MIESELNTESGEEFNNESINEEKVDEELTWIPEVIVEPFDDLSDKNEYEIADIPSPFCKYCFISECKSFMILLHFFSTPKALPSAAVDSDPVETTITISVVNDRLQISSTASIPIKQSLLGSISSIVRKIKPEIHIGGGIEKAFNDHHALRPTDQADWHFCQKRKLSEDSECSKPKCRKIQPEIIVID